MDWKSFGRQWGQQFVSTTGRPALPTRLLAVLLYLKHAYALNGEDVIARLVENPYRRHFSGKHYFRHVLPCAASSLVRRRQKIGEGGREWLLTHSIEAATKAGVVNRRTVEQVLQDTPVQPKAIAHPTVSRLLNRAREQLVVPAKNVGFELRQSNARGQARRPQGRSLRPLPAVPAVEARDQDASDLGRAGNP